MIYVECKPDKVLIENLDVLEKEKIYHCGGKGRVVSNVLKGKKNYGLIDEDPLSPQPRKLKNFEKKYEKYGIKIMGDDKENKLIILCPNLERWILKVVKENSIDIKKYGLPEEGEELHSIINTNINSFIKLLKELKRTKEFEFFRNIFNNFQCKR
ncbi:MAG: hypothetical protein ACP5OB_03545 [Candidatus Ratteibacteria bacterium]